MLDWLYGLIALAWLIFPGWLLARAWGLAFPLLAAFLGGALALVSLVFWLQCAGLGLNRGSLGIGWLALTAAAAWWSRRARPPAPPEAAPERRNLWPYWAVSLPVIAVVTWRASAHPLFGIDTHFRWGYLAEQMWARGHLDFYPPTIPAHFEIYGWPDGIPPLISSLYLGCYALADAARPTLTVPVVVAQWVFLLSATGALARRAFSRDAEGWAIALLGVTPLAAWATAKGQETGLMALAVVGFALYLPRSRAEETTPALLAAGGSLAVAALGREYGWAFVAAGLLISWRRGLSARGLVILSVAVAATALPWYLRNAALTGNPLYNQSLAGFFHINTPHAGLMDLYRETFALGPVWSREPLLPFAHWFAVALAGLAGMLAASRAAPGLDGFIVVAVGLWMVSVGFTAAGFVYSLRVLNSALALMAVLGGAALARRLDGPRSRRLGLLVLGLLSLDGAARTLVLPQSPYAVPPRNWLGVDDAFDWFMRRPLYAEIARLVGGGRTLVLGPDNLLARHGVRTVPFWSPDVAWLFAPQPAGTSPWARLRALGIHHVVVSRGTVNQRYLARSPAFAAATGAELRPVLQTPDIVVFSLDEPESASISSPQPPTP